MSERLLDPGFVAILIPISAIIMGGLIVIAKVIIQHRERMAKIGMGMDPDARPADDRDRARR
jgi:hypothetical protein